MIKRLILPKQFSGSIQDPIGFASSHTLHDSGGFDSWLNQQVNVIHHHYVRSQHVLIQIVLTLPNRSHDPLCYRGLLQPQWTEASFIQTPVEHSELFSGF